MLFASGCRTAGPGATQPGQSGTSPGISGGYAVAIGNGDRTGLRDAVERYIVSALTENFNIAFQDVAPRCRETTQGKKLQERLITLKHRKIVGPVRVQIITFSSRRRTAVVSYSAAHGSITPRTEALTESLCGSAALQVQDEHSR